MKSLLALLLMSAPAYAYDLKNLSPQDILIIGQGLDELPRRVGDTNNLYSRIQAQLREQDAAASKAQEEAARKKTASTPKPEMKVDPPLPETTPEGK